MAYPMIRRATSEDAGALAAFAQARFVETFVEDFAIPYPAADLEAYLRDTFSVDATRAGIADAEGAVWIVDLDGTIGGYAMAGPNGLPHPDALAGDRELKRFYLRRDLQGSGVADPLMRAVSAWLDPGDDGAAWIGVWSGNVRAQRFYARYGFAKVGEYDFRVGASVDREFILRRLGGACP